MRGDLRNSYQANQVFSITNTIYMENKYNEFVQDELNKFLKPQKNLMFSAELLVLSSSKYVIAAFVNHWFKKKACKMAHVMKILCSGNWLFTWKTKVGGQFRVRQEFGDPNKSPGTVRTVTWYSYVHLWER